MVLLFLITLITGNKCVTYSQNDIDLTMYQSMISQIDVFDADTINDTFIKISFNNIYNINNMIVLCTAKI